MTRILLAALMASAIAAVTAAKPASANFLTRKEIATGRVTACSTYHVNRCITATIVKGRFGTALRTASGHIVDCDGDCKTTLRRATVDFWNDQRERNR